MALINKAIELLKSKSIPAPNAVHPPTPAQIANVEATLGFTIPPSFLIFLADAGSHALSYWETYWIGDESLGWRNIVKVNLSERSNVESSLPAFLIAFHNNGWGDQLCFDTRKVGKDGEYQIVFWNHERTAEENLRDLTPVANTFAEWLMGEVDAHR